MSNYEVRTRANKMVEDRAKAIGRQRIKAMALFGIGFQLAAMVLVMLGISAYQSDGPSGVWWFFYGAALLEILGTSATVIFSLDLVDPKSMVSHGERERMYRHAAASVRGDSTRHAR